MVVNYDVMSIVRGPISCNPCDSFQLLKVHTIYNPSLGFTETMVRLEISRSEQSRDGFTASSVPTPQSGRDDLPIMGSSYTLCDDGSDVDGFQHTFTGCDSFRLID